MSEIDVINCWEMLSKEFACFDSLMGKGFEKKKEIPLIKKKQKKTKQNQNR